MALVAIREIALKLDRLAPSYKVGQLQEIRRELKGRKRLAGKTIFNPSTIKADYAFHYGGRSELQFNIGYETVGSVVTFRHGVAFSLETSQALSDISILFPKAARYNEFIRLYREDLEDLRMWHWHKKVRSTDYSISPIPPERLVNRTFIFIGRHYSPAELDYDRILQDFDRLLPLYEFTESRVEAFPHEVLKLSTLRFLPGNRPRKTFTVAALSARIVDVSLRHNQIQQQLHDLLSDRYGSDNVSSECITGVGTRVDTAVRQDAELWYFEIKTGMSARSCIRQALPQLLEYSFWPGGERASRLIIVGEPPLDRDAKTYLNLLSSEFRLPVEYMQLNLEVVPTDSVLTSG